MGVFCIIHVHFDVSAVRGSEAQETFSKMSLFLKRESDHTAPDRCQPDRSVTLDIMIDSSYCDQDMTISVAG